MEKKRVDRSKAPLSIALFFLRPISEGGTKVTSEFLRHLDELTRETDIKGWIDENQIGVILPNTDDKGVKFYIEKIFQEDGHFDYSVTTGTYPDQLFQQLLTEKDGQPDLFPLDLDERVNSLRLQRALKRGIDVAGSFLGFSLLSPLMCVISLAIKINSSGPVIFKQTRLGMKGERFPLYKFRSMYLDVDDRIHREYVGNLIGGRLGAINQGDRRNPFFKMKDDPRITRVGKIIRNLSMDELPQLFNVFKGQMSLVGPRPPIPYEIERYEPWHLRRILEMKPGLTGLWQVSGRSTTTFDEMVRLDLRYVRNWSLWLDLKILAKTVREVLRPHNAA
jgi:lipopolysaccharide/colanic/teichoic acid biosynthesis glycosyltransferase